jgi:hypothetical protein
MLTRAGDFVLALMKISHACASKMLYLDLLLFEVLIGGCTCELVPDQPWIDTIAGGDQFRRLE